MDTGVVAEALEVLEITEADTFDGEDPFTPAERAYALSKADPSRRLAARLAAKRAASRLLGVPLGSIEVLKDTFGPPRLRLSREALAALKALGASRALVSLTHGATHAAASVVLVADEK